MATSCYFKWNARLIKMLIIYCYFSCLSLLRLGVVLGHIFFFFIRSISLSRYRKSVWLHVPGFVITDYLKKPILQADPTANIPLVCYLFSSILLLPLVYLPPQSNWIVMEGVSCLLPLLSICVYYELSLKKKNNNIGIDK